MSDLTQKLERVRKVNSIDFAQLLADKTRKRVPCAHIEVLQGVAAPDSPYEFQRTVTPCKFFFDYDQACTPADLQDEEGLARLERELKERIQCVLGPHVPAGVPYEICAAQRHGVSGDKCKISFHFYVSGFKTDMFSVKNAIMNHSLIEPDILDVFDMSVYATSRRYCAILCKKRASDPRVLIPTDWEAMDDSKFNPHNILKYMVQHVEKDWPTVIVEPMVSQAHDPDAEPVRKSRRVGDDDWEPDESMSRVDRERLKAQAEGFNKLVPILKKNGFVNPRRTSLPRVEEGVVYLDFDCERRDDCPLCHAQHEHNMWCLSMHSEKGVYVTNYSERCIRTNLFDPVFLDKTTQLYIMGSESHFDFAEAFQTYAQGSYLFNPGTGAFHHFDGSKWSIVDDRMFKKIVFVYFMKQTLLPSLETVSEWKTACIAIRLTKEGKEKVDNLYQKLSRVRDRAGSATFINNVINILQSLLFVPADSFDNNTNYLHFDNCKLDLNTMETHETVPSDMNTLTTGYDLHFDVPSEEEALHNEMLNKIYPDPAVREVAQRVFGCSLTGDCHMKRFFVHTDKGGDVGGNNGKTLMFDVHTAAMGGYAIKPRKEIFYSSTATNSEQATPGFAALQGKRVSLTEELDPRKPLNMGDIKEWTNGTNCKTKVRQLHKNFVDMTITAKFHVGVNHCKFPYFDTSDTAFRDRLLPVPYISHFTDKDHKLDSVHHIYKRCPEFGREAKQCRLAHILWCIEGFKRMKEMGMGDNTVSDYMLRFKEEFIFKQSLAYDVLADIMVDTQDLRRDIVDVEDAWQEYKNDKRFQKFTNKDEFTTTFRVFVNSKVPNSFQFDIVDGNKRRYYARGFKIREKSDWRAQQANNFY